MAPPARRAGGIAGPSPAAIGAMQPMMDGMGMKPQCLLQLCLAAALCAGGGCQPHKPAVSPVGSGAPVSGDVTRSTEQARAETARAYELICKGKYAQAEPVVKRAIEYDPMYGPAHNNAGLVYYQQGRLYDAAWEFEKAIKLMPGQPQPRNNLGLVLEQAGRAPEAVASYEQAVKLAPDSPEYVGNLARARVRMGDRDAQTQELLGKLLLIDTRPAWLDWARSSLLRIRGANPEDATTRPASGPSVE